ncbi:MAG TPA: acetyl-CoA carboxylase biotin carboxyl carrier protein [Phycisphaerae bacterium]|nr:acetyl-CoA carboxylase biotin carboxyl carrier protein [Phycisphaerae bacterium]HUU22053.1 acetyl-CoA carboxylase biotin carboxyl carrier protein [Phycisphaerae bacterium]
MDIDIEQVRDLVRLMVDNDLSELDITEGESKIKLRRGRAGEVVMAAPALPAGQVVPIAAPPRGPAEPPAPAETLLEIKSPMVGTFYSCESPDAGPFVSVGDTIADDTVVCIVEAMKVMNEIKAECAGQITEVCVGNAQPVEYGQVLFRLRPV